MRELLYELYVCTIIGDDFRAAEIIESICTEYSLLCNVIEDYRFNCKNLMSAIDTCCKEIRRLEKENRRYKNGID